VRSFTFSWLPLLVYAGLIFYLSSLPNPPQPFTFSSADKVLHIVEYAILGILIINLLKHYFPDQGNKQLISLAVVLSTLYGISDEFHQYFVPFRDANLFDVLADGIGSCLGVFLYGYFTKKRE
jgi:VanZ family protein